MEENIVARLIELADRSYASGMFTFTDFLGMAEISDLHKNEAKLRHAGVTLFGGYKEADRCVARFGNVEALGYEVPFPVVCVHVQPLIKKFADNLTHRDFLGALMNLGIERSTTGDIKVTDKEAYIFCLDNIAQYICDNLDKVKHTSVKCSLITELSSIPENITNEEPEEKVIILSSLRVDALISKVYNLSRNESITLFQSQKVYVDGRLCENNSQQIKDGSVINARGYGKFRVCGDAKETKKGRISVSVQVW